jgi:hypothetical protein
VQPRRPDAVERSLECLVEDRVEQEQGDERSDPAGDLCPPGVRYRRSSATPTAVTPIAIAKKAER